MERVNRAGSRPRRAGGRNARRYTFLSSQASLGESRHGDGRVQPGHAPRQSLCGKAPDPSIGSILNHSPHGIDRETRLRKTPSRVSPRPIPVVFLRQGNSRSFLRNTPSQLRTSQGGHILDRSSIRIGSTSTVSRHRGAGKRCHRQGDAVRFANGSVATKGGRKTTCPSQRSKAKGGRAMNR